MTNETYDRKAADRIIDNQTHDVNRWIVTSQEFVEHHEPQAAHEECERLTKMFPGRTYRVLRVKSRMIPPGAIVSLPQEGAEIVNIPPRFNYRRGPR